MKSIGKFKLMMFDRYGWFKNEFSGEFNNRGHFNYLMAHPRYMLGKIGNSKHFPEYVFWNTTGQENAGMFPTIYMPKAWFPTTITLNVPKILTATNPKKSE